MCKITLSGPVWNFYSTRDEKMYGRYTGIWGRAQHWCAQSQSFGKPQNSSRICRNSGKIFLPWLWESGTQNCVPQIHMVPYAYGKINKPLLAYLSDTIQATIWREMKRTNFWTRKTLFIMLLRNVLTTWTTCCYICSQPMRMISDFFKIYSIWLCYIYNCIIV